MIKELEIKKFRNIEGETLKLGKVVTLISGQNGVGKSTLLGLIGQPFGYYNGKKWGASQQTEEKTKYDLKDIYGDPFETEFKDIFRLSSIYDHPDFNKDSKVVTADQEGMLNQYYYSLKFYENKFQYDSISGYIKDRGKDDDTLRVVISEYDKKTPLPYSTLIYPTKYLGLNRVLPIVDLSKEQIEETNFTESEKEFFQKAKNYILLLEEEYEESLLTEGKVKKTVISTSNYNYEGMSIGQDNISKIISTIISFERLKNKQNRLYQGGILLIDEIETTLFPAAQHNLIKFLYEHCKRLKIQLVATTHSVELLKYVSLNKSKFEVENDKFKISYLKKRGEKVSIKNDYDYRKIAFDLTLLDEKEKKDKISIYFEDKEAKIVFKKILGDKIFTFYDYIDVNLGHGNYISLYQHKFEEFHKNIVVLDGDANDASKYSHAGGKVPSNFVFLPGETPEKLVYDYLNSLSDNHEFWKGKYTRQIFTNNYREKIENKLNQGMKERELWKNWFKDEIINWGTREGTKVFNSLKKEKPELKEKLLENLRVATKYVIEKYQRPIEIEF